LASSGPNVNGPGFFRLSRGGHALVAGFAAAALVTGVVRAETSPPQKPRKHAAHPVKKKGKKRSASPAFPADGDHTKASQYARLTPSECFAELARRGVRVRRLEGEPGVLEPVRLEGPVSGVTYRSDYSDAQREKLPYDVFECRLVVALSDFGAILRTHDVTEVRIFSAWRPPPKSWPEGKPAYHHPGALAADLRLFKKSSCESLDVEPNFHGRIGAPPCGPNAVPPEPATPAALELRSILCAAADARLFHVLLSPNYDVPHRNHFHVEVRPEVRWLIVR
jgi:hypothetical protein